MKKLTVLAFAGAALLFTACNDKKETVKDAQEVAAKTGEAYKVDLASSNVNWKAFHKGGFAPRWGTISLKSGELTVADNAVTSGDFVIDMPTLKVDPASVTEADKKPADLEKHLKSADFFNVEKNPTSDFKITSVADLAGTPAKDAVAGSNKTISGNLTLQGKTLNVSFPAKVNVAKGVVSLESNKFSFDRQKFDVAYKSSMKDVFVKDEIEMTVKVSAK